MTRFPLSSVLLRQARASEILRFRQLRARAVDAEMRRSVFRNVFFLEKLGLDLGLVCRVGAVNYDVSRRRLPRMRTRLLILLCSFASCLQAFSTFKAYCSIGQRINFLI